jgi:SAM-dependent methyltransferase
MLDKITRLLAQKAREAGQGVRGTSAFVRDWQQIRKLALQQPDFPVIDYYPVLTDRYVESGNLTHHYFDQDLTMAQRIFQNNPAQHVDIGSRIDGFVAHVATFRPIELFDIRPLNRSISNVTFRQVDFMQLPDELIEYTDSISSLHVIEHFGLGRYGDPLDVNGHLKALDNIYRVLKPGGRFYFSTPVSTRQGIVFNAHRVFQVDYLVRLFEQRYAIENFWLIDDNNTLRSGLNYRSEAAHQSFGCSFGCGMFELIKK